MTVRQLVGDCRVQLDTLEPGSVQCCVSSPPYWGLRDYGTPPLVWGGDEKCNAALTLAINGTAAIECEHGYDACPICDSGHAFGAAVRAPWANSVPGPSDNHPKNGTASHWTPKVSGQFCACGAWLGSLGLEPDPTMYVEHIVECFRHVRRVLRDDGTLWVNLGDSYAGSGKGPSNSVQSDASQIGPSAVKKRNPAQFANGQAPTAWLSVPAGVKPKDLMMIPFRVAMALQQPYYAGRIQSEVDRVWLAAMIDTEGSICVNLLRGGVHRKNDSYGLSVRVHNTSLRLIQRCAQVARAGSVGIAEDNGRTIYQWTVFGPTAKALLRELYPHFVAKQHEARLGYGRIDADGYAALQALHHGSETTVDPADPPSCFEPGWYLRSVIPWLKRNSMPESVQDRPSTSVEYVFLLSKRERYFWDQAAVRLPFADNRMGADGSGKNRERNVGGRTDGYTTPNGVYPIHNGGRTRRNGDWWFESWQGLMLDEQAEPLALVVNPQPFKESHFATFPPKLVEPMVKASTRPGDVILDPFGGAGTVGLVADRLGRNAVLVDLKPEYGAMATGRLTSDAPMFVEIAEAPA